MSAGSAVSAPATYTWFPPYPPLVLSTTSPSNPYAALVITDGAYSYYKMNTTSGTETDFGTGGNPLTYTGSGTRGGAALIADSDAASYSPLGNDGTNYALAAEPLSAWPTATVITWVGWIKPSTADCNPANAGAFNVIWSEDSPGSTGPFDVGLTTDSTTCHIVVQGDNGSNSAAAANGTMAANTIYMVAFEYDKTAGLKAYVNNNSTPVATNSATYYNAWNSTFNGPFFVGARGSTSVVNTPNTSVEGLGGFISDVATFPTELTTGQLATLYATGV